MGEPTPCASSIRLSDTYDPVMGKIRCRRQDGHRDEHVGSIRYFVGRTLTERVGDLSWVDGKDGG